MADDAAANNEERAHAIAGLRETLQLIEAGNTRWSAFVADNLREVDLTGLPPADDPYWIEVAGWHWAHYTVTVAQHLSDLGEMTETDPAHQFSVWAILLSTVTRLPGLAGRLDLDEAIDDAVTIAHGIMEGLRVPDAIWHSFQQMIPPRPADPPGTSLDTVLARGDIRAALLRPVIDAYTVAAKTIAGPKPVSEGHEKPFSLPALTMTSDAHTRAFIRSLWAASAGAWIKPVDGPPYFKANKQDVTVYIREQEPDGSVWEAVLSLADDMASTFLICMGKWFAETHGGGEHVVSTRVHANDILAFRGIKRHKGSYRPDQKEEVRRGILALNGIWIRSNETIYERIGASRRKRKKQVAVDSRLIEVAIESEQTVLGEEIPYAFRVRPGEWITPYLGEDNRQTAILLQPVMRYEPSKGVGRMAMRLGIYLAPQWRIRSAHNTYEQPWSVRTLFEAAYLTISPDRRTRDRTREYFEEALDRLKDDGVLGGWEYVTGNEADLPPRGWWDVWLDWKLCITPPDSIKTHYEEIPRRRQRAIARNRSTAKGAPPSTVT